MCFVSSWSRSVDDLLEEYQVEKSPSRSKDLREIGEALRQRKKRRRENPELEEIRQKIQVLFF